MITERPTDRRDAAPPPRPPRATPRPPVDHEPEPERAPIRPGHRTRTSPVGSLLLSAAGVDRDVLAEVPEERDRYIGIGGTVVGTAGVATGSMAMLVATVLHVDGWGIVIPAVLWGLLIFNLDRWLISSTHGTERRRMLIPRLGLAVLLGIVVAEPLVLWMFHSAIDQELATQRTAELTTLESDLTFCNPTDPTQTEANQAEARCDGLALNVNPPAGTTEAIAALKTQLAEAEGDRNVLRLQETDLVNRLQRERAGEGGGDTTGERGLGPVSAALQADLDALRGRLATAEQLVLSLQNELKSALVTSTGTSGDYADRLQAAITTRLDEEEAKFSTEPGLLERLEALGDLTSRHNDLRWARLFLTLSIVALDCMPVIAKAMSGKTTYDGLLQARLAARERAARSSLTSEGDEWAAEIGLRSFRRDQERLVVKRRIEVERDKQLLLLDTEHREDRAQHGGSAAQIRDALFEDGPSGPVIELSWEQPRDTPSRLRRFPRLRRNGPRTAGPPAGPPPSAAWTPNPSWPPGPPVTGPDAGDPWPDPEPWHVEEGFTWGPPTGQGAADDVVDDGPLAWDDDIDDEPLIDLSDDATSSRPPVDQDPTIPDAGGAGWYEQATRLDPDALPDDAR